jgi:cyclopropane-fatty-acyl-phospholipid synthase
MLLARCSKALVRDGALTLIDAAGETYRLGRPGRAVDVVVRLHDSSLHHRIVRSPLRALGEAYAEGMLTLEVGDVYDLLDLCAHNLDRWWAHPEARAGRALGWVHALLGSNAPARPAALGEAPGEYYLDRDRHDSCAYFSDPRMTLEEAQEAKKQHLASKLLLRPGQRVLEVGAGWGSLALHLADAGGVEVTGIGCSERALVVARRRAVDAGLSARVSFHERTLREEKGTYDRVLSVSALEHVGAPRAVELFGGIRDRLAEDGVAVVHSVARVAGPRAPILRAGAPGPLSDLLATIARARLWVTDVEILRLHYADTLRCWRRRFVSNWGRVGELYGARRCRAWEFDLALAEARFRRGGLAVVQLQVARRPDAVPLTREYIYRQGPAWAHELGVAA